MKKLAIGIIFSMLIIPAATSMMVLANEDYDNNGEEEEFFDDYIEKGTKVKSSIYGTGIVERVVDYKGKVVYAVVFDKAGKKFVKPKDIQKL